MKDKFVDQSLRIGAALALLVAFAIGIGGCGPGTSDTATAVPLDAIDLKLNAYEKTTNDFIKVSKRLRHGDVSVSVRYIDLEEQVQRWPARLQQGGAKMTPQQAQRMSAISTQVAPYLRK